MKKLYNQGKSILIDPSNVEVWRMVGFVILLLLSVTVTLTWFAHEIIKIIYDQNGDGFKILMNYIGTLCYVVVITCLIVYGNIKIYRMVKYNLIKFKKNIH